VEDDAERSEGGSRIFRHTEPDEGFVPGDASPYAEAIEAHVERHVGPIDNVFHELASEYVHLDVLQVPAREQRPWHTLVTCGMSALPMAVPDGADEPRLAELMIALPPDWPLDQESWRDERHYWPVRLIKLLGRLPHVYGTYLATGHTVPNGDPAEPYAPDTDLCCALIAPPLLIPEDAFVLETEGGALQFYGVVTLYQDESELKLRHGMDPLVDALDEAEVSELVAPRRRSAVRRRKRFGLF
jgi:hypothetical protein